MSLSKENSSENKERKQFRETRLICITGLPGSGKSTVAELIKRNLEEKGVKTKNYTTDWVRFKLYPELLSNKEELARDFTSDELERSYNGLFMLIDEMLDANTDLVIITDGTYRTESQRSQLVDIARKNNGKCWIIKTEVAENVLIPRLEKRLEEGKGSGIESYRSTKDVYEEPTGDNVLHIRNDGSLIDLQNNINQIIGLLSK